MKKLIVMVTVLSGGLNSFGQTEKHVLDAEKAFAKYALDYSTKKAFLNFMDSNAVVFNRGVISNGIKTWQSFPEGTGKLIWGPSYGAISKSGDLGFTTGAYESRVNDTVRGSGQYTTVWNKTKNGEWKFLVDLGTFYRPSQWGKQASVTFSAQLTPANLNDTSVFELENKFIQSFTAGGYKAYESVIDNHTWLNFDGRIPAFPMNAEELSFIPSELKFTPVKGRTSSARDLAFVYGTTDLNGKTENYLRVWGHTKAGWKLLVQVLKGL